ncbi:MAG TPA: sigma-70 family RNA polymerase sigma factor [Blastocatellia bacterium]|nr:sigma-70 family RNA polymerase sigma factor [Blastocatellia bacterium]
MPTKESFCLNLAGFDLEYGTTSNPRSLPFYDGRFAVMTNEDFIARYARPIAALWKTVATRYGVTEREFADRLATILARMGNSSESKVADADSTSNSISNLRAGELCLAIACEKGDESAWRAFDSEYRHAMQGAARALTRDEAEGEDLTQFVYGELYGVRLDGDKRLSKLTHYSGRGSLGGWLRAVVYQAFIDRKRQTSRFEQVEEIAEFDRLANEAAAHVNGRLSAPIAPPDDIEDARLRQATEEAMTQAFAEIEARDRLLLNYYYFDDLTLREIGLMMGVHEATISRWLAKAQREVKRKTEEILQRSYGLRRTEVAECLQIAARTELDVRRLVVEVGSPSIERAP